MMSNELGFVLDPRTVALGSWGRWWWNRRLARRWMRGWTKRWVRRWTRRWTWMASEDPLVVSRPTGSWRRSARRLLGSSRSKQLSPRRTGAGAGRYFSHRPPHNSHQRTISAKTQCQDHLISCEAVKCLILFKCKWLMGNTAS